MKPHYFLLLCLNLISLILSMESKNNFTYRFYKNLIKVKNLSYQTHTLHQAIFDQHTEKVRELIQQYGSGIIDFDPIMGTLSLIYIYGDLSNPKNKEIRKIIGKNGGLISIIFTSSDRTQTISNITQEISIITNKFLEDLTEQEKKTIEKLAVEQMHKQEVMQFLYDRNQAVPLPEPIPVLTFNFIN